MADKIKLIDPFTNISLADIPVATNENQGGVFLSNLRELNIGDGGSNVFRADQQGLWLGAGKFADAPFSVSMAGIGKFPGLVVGTNVGMGTAKQVFTTTPTTPYYVGDLWAAGSSGDLKRCITQKLTGAYDAAHWGLASKYTDDSNTTTIIGNTVTTGFINALAITVLGAVTAGSFIGLTVTGGILRTSAETDVDRIIISGANNDIEFWSSANAKTGELSTWYNPVNGAGGMELTASGLIVNASGKSNMGEVFMGLPAGTFFGLDWYGNDPTTERIITDARIDADWLPFSNNDCDLGSSTYKWKDGHFSGNIIVDGNVDGVDISVHAGNADAHHAQSHSHASHSGIGADDHHSSISNGLNITPASVNAGSGALKGGSLYYGTTQIAVLTGGYFDLYRPVINYYGSLNEASEGSKGMMYVKGSSPNEELRIYLNGGWHTVDIT